MSEFIRILTYKRIREEHKYLDDFGVRRLLIEELYGIRLGPE